MNTKVIMWSATLTALTLLGTLCWYLHRAPAQEIPESTIQTAFTHWTTEHKKLYSITEQKVRYENFKKNYLFAIEHNKKYQNGESTFKLGMTLFADLTNEEFKTQAHGLIPRSNFGSNQKILDTTNLPTTVDWRKQNAVTPVKNQGSCGSCWAFSTTGSMEGLHAIKTKSLLSFSEQQLVDCSTKYGNQGCQGGLMDDAFQYVEANGITTEKQYPYEGSNDKCTYTHSEEVWTIKGYQDVQANTTSQLLAAVAQQPVSVAIEADSIFFQLYFGGVFSYGDCGTNLDHGVLAVGYGTDSGKDYWLIKNSWGGSWGESGYIRLVRNGDGPGECGVQMQPSYPTV